MIKLEQDTIELATQYLDAYGKNRKVYTVMGEFIEWLQEKVKIC